MSRRSDGAWRLTLTSLAAGVALCVLLSVLHQWRPAAPDNPVWRVVSFNLPHHPALLPSFFGVPSAVGAAMFLAAVSLCSVARLWWRTRRALAPLIIPLPLAGVPGLRQLLREEALERHVTFIQAERPLVFCYGYWRPRILLSSGMVSALSHGELRAVLQHEEWHRRRRDPLRALLADALCATFFFFPVVTEWRVRFRLQMELDADRFAVQRRGRAPLAGALHRLLRHERSVPGASFVGISASAVRIAVLLNEPVALPALSPRRALVSLAVLGLLCLALL